MGVFLLPPQRCFKNLWDTFDCHNDLEVLLAFIVWMPEKLDTLKCTELPREQRPSDVPPDIHVD